MTAGFLLQQLTAGLTSGQAAVQSVVDADQFLFFLYKVYSHAALRPIKLRISSEVVGLRSGTKVYVPVHVTFSQCLV